MINFESIPLWVMLVSALVLSVLAAGGISSVMGTRSSKVWTMVAVPAGGLSYIGLSALVKRYSLHQAILLYDDGMLTLACITLVLVLKLRRDAARRGVDMAALTREDGRKAGMLAVTVGFLAGVLVLIAEYLLAYQHQL